MAARARMDSDVSGVEVYNGPKNNLSSAKRRSCQWSNSLSPTLSLQIPSLFSVMPAIIVRSPSRIEITSCDREKSTVWELAVIASITRTTANALRPPTTENKSASFGYNAFMLATSACAS